MPGRTWPIQTAPDNTSAGTKPYRYGFNGKESDFEVSGSGNQYDYGFRIYNPRLGRFLSTDPLTQSYPMLTPYQFASNTPIMAIDLDGLEAIVKIHSKWFLNQIQKSIDAGDVLEAQRLAWAAVNAEMPDGSPAATFKPSPNGITGFNIKDDNNSILLSTADNTVYLGAKRPWAEDGIDYAVIKDLNKKINSKKQALVDTKNEIETLNKKIQKIESEYEQMQQSLSDGDNDNVGGPSGGIAAAIIANVQVNVIQEEIGKLDKKKDSLSTEIKKLETQKAKVIDTNKKAEKKGTEVTF